MSKSAVVTLDSVPIWFDKIGSGPPLVALHPGLVDSRVFGPNLTACADQFSHISN